MVVHDLVQKTPEWLAWRKTGIGGSDAPTIIHGKHFSTTIEQLWEQKCGRSAAASIDRVWAVQQGVIGEPVIRAWAEAVLEFKMESICGSHEDFVWAKGSFDGWHEPTGTVVEIKVCSQVDHRTALDEGLIPTKYIPQVEHLFLVAGKNAKRVVYLSHCKFVHPSESKAIVVYTPTHDSLEHLKTQEQIFWQAVQEQNKEILKKLDCWTGVQEKAKKPRRRKASSNG